MKAEHIQGNQIDRAEWDSLVSRSPQGMFYHLTSYMDIVGPGWSGITVRNDGKLVALMPLLVKQKMSVSYFLQPFFTQYWGPVLEPGAALHTYKHYSHRKKVLTALVEVLPPSLKKVAFGCSPALDYALPFHWAGFELHTRFSYRITPSAEEGKLLAGYDASTRQLIQKNTEAQAHIRAAENAEEVMELIQQNLAAGKPVIPPGTNPTARKVLDWVLQTGQGKIWLYAPDGKVSAAIVVVRFNGVDTYQLGVSGADKTGVTLLIHHALGQAQEAGMIFDFEGSMIPGIESFFRGFGAAPVPYLQVVANRLPLFLRWIKK